MTESSEQIQFEQVARRINPRAKLRRSWTLVGGISAQVVGLEIEQPGGDRQKLVFRRHGAADLAANPRVAADEFALMQILTAEGLPVPAPYHIDESRDIFPTPYLVVEFIDGAPDLSPGDLADFLGQLADVLARTHTLDGANPALNFLPRLADQVAKTLRDRPAVLDDSLDEGRIRDTLEAAWPLPQSNPLTLVHGDFWPGNVLWKDGELRAIIDWEDAVLGDPLADLANMRLELLWAFGAEAMYEFTRRYRAFMPALDDTDLSFWDLWAALRPAGRLSGWGIDAETEARMRRLHREFVAGRVGMDRR